MNPSRPFNPFAVRPPPAGRGFNQFAAQAPIQRQQNLVQLSELEIASRRVREDELRQRTQGRIARLDDSKEEIINLSSYTPSKREKIVIGLVKNNDIASLSLLLENEDPLQILTSVRDEFKNTPLMIAVLGMNKQMVEFILSVCSKLSILELCLEDSDVLGRTPLLLSLTRESLSITKLLFDRGANVDRIDDSGKSALHLISKGTQNDDMKIRLLQLFPSLDINQQDNSGDTPLMLVKESQSLVAEELLERGANPNIPNRSGNTALHIKPALTSILLSHRADPNIQDSMGNTPLHICRELNVMRELLERGADPDIQNMDGDTPLHFHQLRLYQKLLLEFGANPNIPNNEGRLPQLL